MIAQRDFGGFDSSFHGATVKLSSKSDWEAFQAFKKDGRAWPDPDLSDTELFTLLSIASVLAHEVRHFHDFLITPYGARVFLLRNLAAMNALQLLIPITNSSANCLPFPIQKWCSLDEAGRKAEKEWWGQRKDGTKWSPVPLPYVEKFKAPPTTASLGNGTEGLIGAAIWNTERIGQLAHSSAEFFCGAEIEAWQVYELSALLVQLSELERHHSGLAERYQNYLIESQKNAYGDILRLIKNMWATADEPFDYARTSICVYWSLLGDPTRDGEKACPAYRLARLSKLIAKDGWRWGMSFSAAIGSWSRVFKLSKTDEGLSCAASFFDRLVSHVDRAASHPNLVPGYPEFAKWASIVRKIKASSDHMISSIRSRPMSYVDPQKYIDEAHTWVNPNVRTIVEGFMKFDPQLLAQDDLFALEWEIGELDGGPFTAFAERGTSSPHVFVSLNDSLFLSGIIGAMDALFRHEGSYAPEAQAARRIFWEESSLTSIKILS